MKILENITKDKVATTFGGVCFLLAFLNFLGYIHFPGQSWCSPEKQCMITAAIGIVFCFVDLKVIKDKITTIFNKKSDNL